MTRSISRTVLTTLALILLVAGSRNLNPASADKEAGAGDICSEFGCAGGPYFCASVVLSDGTIIQCFMA